MELISGLAPDATFAGPAQRSAIDALARGLGQPVPAELAELLLETNGVAANYGTDVIWSAEQILEQNRSFRSDPDFAKLYMPFEPLMFFADNGGGDQFAYVRQPERPDVFAWDHETDGRSWAARDLRDYLNRCLPSDGDDWYR